MPKLVDMTGQTFGELTVLSYIGYSKWQCQCSCGCIHVATRTNLKHSTRSCGCTNRTKKLHYRSKDPLYKLWKRLKRRCLDPTDSLYYCYGAKGISLCKRWADFASFQFDLSPMPHRARLHRRDKKGHYSPENCYWGKPKKPQKESPFIYGTNGRLKGAPPALRQYSHNEKGKFISPPLEPPPIPIPVLKVSKKFISRPLRFDKTTGKFTR